MQKTVLISLLIFFSNINEHYPDSNDYNKNTFINYYIYIEMFGGEIIYFNKLYNDYGINYEKSLEFSDISHMYFLNNTSDTIKEIFPDTFIFVDTLEIFEKVINQLDSNKLYTYQDSIVIFINDNILNDLKYEEVFKYKQISKCLIITYKGISLSPFYEIKDNALKMRSMQLNINLLSYSKYPINIYIILICILFLLTNISLFLFVINYMNIDDKDKLGIHKIIIFILKCLVEK